MMPSSTSSALSSLSKHDMRLDDLNRVRVLDEEAETHAQALSDGCNEFVRDTKDFRAIADGFIEIFDHLSQVRNQPFCHVAPGINRSCPNFLKQILHSV